MKTRELVGVELDSYVGVALGLQSGIKLENGLPLFKTYQCPYDSGPHESDCGDDFEPSSMWSHGGPLIERYQIWLSPRHDQSDPLGYWVAKIRRMVEVSLWKEIVVRGNSPLEAAMRAVVILEIGEEVE